MAIYTGGLRQDMEQRAAGQRIANQEKKAKEGSDRQKKRSFWGGKAASFLAGQALSTLGGMALTGLTGGAINPLTMKIITAGLRGVGTTAGKAAAHQATTGKWDKALPGNLKLKSPGQVDKIEAGGEFGYGIGRAKTLSEGLAESRKSDVDLGTLAGDVAGAIVADVGMDKLKEFGKGKLGEFTSDKFSDSKMLLGEEGARSYGIGGGDFAEQVTKQANIDNLDLDEANFWDYADGGTGFDDVSIETEFAQGGQVPQQQQLLAMLALAQMQQKETAYSGTALEEKQPSTIADMFASQGKTLGGNNINSIAQMLGK